MSFDKLIEKMIKEGMKNGEFDNLEGKGRPIDLDTYFSVPEDVRVGLSVLKNAEVIPPEMEMLREINELKAQMRACNDRDQSTTLNRRLNHALLKYNLLMDSYRRSRK